MSTQFVVTADDVIEQLLIQCWLFRARAGDYAGARAEAERTLERLLALDLPHVGAGSHMRLDPYAANNMIKARAGELNDPAWSAWQDTAHRNATSLPAEIQHYRFTMRREWHSYAVSAGRPLVLRMPLPLRHSQRGPARVKLMQPTSAAVDIREMPGRIELRVDSSGVDGPIIAEMEVDFVSGETSDSLAIAAPLGTAVSAEEQIWLRDREGLIVQSDAVAALASKLAEGCLDARTYVHSVWRWIISNLRFGDWHRSDLDANSPLDGLLQSRLADCMLGSSLVIALCRSRGIPARLLNGYLLHPANLGPHSWAEVRVAPGEWIPVDFGAWCYSAGNPDDREFGQYFLGRVDARYVAEVAPRDFTGWGSAPPPERWFRLERLDGERIVHTLHTLPGGALFRRDVLDLKILGPTGSPPP